MKKYVVMLSKKTFLEKTSSHATTDINRAFVFNSKEEAKVKKYEHSHSCLV